MTSPAAKARPTWAEVDLDAIRANVTMLARKVAPARLAAVVKADAYGHGTVPVARAALSAGAGTLAVALTEEGAELRAAGIAAPVLLLTEPSPDEVPLAVRCRLECAVYHHDMLQALDTAATTIGTTLRVHVKVDTGMHRVGCQPSEVVPFVKAIEESVSLRLGGVWTHCAVADEPGNPFTDRQLDRFDAVLAELAAHGIEPETVHAANSAATLGHPRSHRDLVRCGIAVYGLPPSPEMAGVAPLQPALSLKSRVAHVQLVEAGEAVSYGHRWRAERPTWLATVPAGYADGVPRNLGINGGSVLIGGRRRPIAGSVTMDQLMVDCGDHPPERGDEVVLIGSQGDERIGAEEWAELMGTIAYEVICGIGGRVPRVYRGDRTA